MIHDTDYHCSVCSGPTREPNKQKDCVSGQKVRQRSHHTNDVYCYTTCESAGVWPTNQSSSEDPFIVTERNNQDQQLHILKRETNAGKVIAVVTHRLTLPQFLLSTVKVKVDIQALHKLCDWIFVGVRFLKIQMKYNWIHLCLHVKSAIAQSQLRSMFYLLTIMTMLWK